MIGVFNPDFPIAGTNRGGFNVPDIGDNLDQPLARFTGSKGNSVSDHIGLSAGPGVRGFRRTRGVVVANDDMLGPQAHLMRGDLRKHRQNPLTDFCDTRHDLRATAVIKLGPGGGAVDYGSTCDAVPACRHSSSAFTGHCAYSAASCFSTAAKRAPNAHSGRTSALFRSLRLSPRETGGPASQLAAFSSTSSARMRLTEPSLAFVCVKAPSRMALMRRMWNGSSPSRSAQISRWDSVANAVCRAPNERNAPDGVLLV